MTARVEITHLRPPDDNGHVGVDRRCKIYPDEKTALRFVRDFNAQFAPTGRIARLMAPGEQLDPIIAPRPRVRGKDRKPKRAFVPRQRARVPGSRRYLQEQTR